MKYCPKIKIKIKYIKHFKLKKPGIKMHEMNIKKQPL
jgi:hypothetical protein